MDLEERLNNKILEVLKWLPPPWRIGYISLRHDLLDQLNKNTLTINGVEVPIYLFADAFDLPAIDLFGGADGSMLFTNDEGSDESLKRFGPVTFTLK